MANLYEIVGRAVVSTEIDEVRNALIEVARCAIGALRERTGERYAAGTCERVVEAITPVPDFPPEHQTASPPTETLPKLSDVLGDRDLVAEARAEETNHVKPRRGLEVSPTFNPWEGSRVTAQRVWEAFLGLPIEREMTTSEIAGHARLPYATVQQKLLELRPKPIRKSLRNENIYSTNDVRDLALVRATGGKKRGVKPESD